MSKQKHNQVKNSADPWRYEDSQFDERRFFVKAVQQPAKGYEGIVGQLFVTCLITLNSQDTLEADNEEWLRAKRNASFALETLYNQIHDPLINHIVKDPVLKADIRSRQDKVLRQYAKSLLEKGVTVDALASLALVHPEWISHWLALGDKKHDHGEPLFNYSQGLLNTLRIYLACCLLTTNLRLGDQYDSVIELYAEHAKTKRLNSIGQTAKVIVQIANESDVFGNMLTLYSFYFHFKKDPYLPQTIGVTVSDMAPTVAYVYLHPPGENKTEWLTKLKWNPDSYNVGRYIQYRLIRKHYALSPQQEENVSFWQDESIKKGVLLPNFQSMANLVGKILVIENQLKQETDGTYLIDRMYNLFGLSRDAAFSILTIRYARQDTDILLALSKFVITVIKSYDADQKQWQPFSTGKPGNTLPEFFTTFPETLRYYNECYDAEGYYRFGKQAPTFADDAVKAEALQTIERHLARQNRSVHPLRRDSTTWALPAAPILKALPAPRRAATVTLPIAPNWFNRDWRPPVQKALLVSNPQPPSDFDILRDALQQLIQSAQTTLRELSNMPVEEHRLLFAGAENMLADSIRRVMLVAPVTPIDEKIQKIAAGILVPNDTHVQITENDIIATEAKIGRNGPNIATLFDRMVEMHTLLEQIHRERELRLRRPVNVTIYEGGQSEVLPQRLQALQDKPEKIHGPGGFADDIALIREGLKEHCKTREDGVPASAINRLLGLRHGEIWWEGRVSQIYNQPRFATKSDVKQLYGILAELDQGLLDVKIERRIHSLIRGPNYWKMRPTDIGSTTWGDGTEITVDIETDGDGMQRVILHRQTMNGEQEDRVVIPRNMIQPMLAIIPTP